MDAFELGVVVLVALAILGCCLAARASAASGRRMGDLGRGRDLQRQAAAQAARREEEDLRDMLAVTNARRRARGLPERSVADAIREFGGD